MSGRDDPLADACRTYLGYMDRLEQLIGQPSAPGPAPDLRVRHAEIPEPYGPPGRALMDGWEGVPRLEAWLKYAGPAGHPGRRRGGSRGNIEDALLNTIPRLAAGLGQYEQGKAYRYVDRLINEAMSCAGIDENPRLRHLPRRAGDRLPPKCPYCPGRYLVANMDSRPVLVYCQNLSCPGDPDGNRAVAVLGTSADGTPQLAWPDRVETAPSLDEDGG